MVKDDDKGTIFSTPSDGEPTAALSGCLVRLGWMAAGNVVLLLIAVTILLEPSWTFTLKDVLFWLAVGGVVLLRYVDVTRLGGLTADGQRATLRDFRRYATVLVAMCAVAWTVVQSFGTAA